METRFRPAERHPHRLPPVVMVTGLPEVTVDMAVPAAVLAVLVVTADTVVQVVVLGAQVAAVTEAQAVVMVDMVVLPAAWAVIESFE